MRAKSIRMAAILVMVLAALLRPSPAARPAGAQSAGTTTRVSVASDGTQAYDYSGDPSISADGRFVAFLSYARNLVSGDTNEVYDVFVHDKETGETTRVSVASDGTQANRSSESPSISADGHFVVFTSYASNLVSGDTNNSSDVFVHDILNGETTRVSIASDGTQENRNSSNDTSISANGRFVGFWSLAALGTDDENGNWDMFVHDRQTHQTTRISVAFNGDQTGHGFYAPPISTDGRFVAFHSAASNLVSGDTNNYWDVFVYDRQSGETVRVSVNSNGIQGNSSSFSPSISSDGRFVIFESWASNLASGDSNNAVDIFVHDRETSKTTRISIASNGGQGNSSSYSPSISSDGRFVAFQSSASNLVSGDTNGRGDIFVHDRQTGETTRVSLASNGVQGNSFSDDPFGEWRFEWNYRRICS